MLQNRSGTHYSPVQPDPRLLPPIAGQSAGVDLERPNARQNAVAAERALDQVLADSFPASDPPSWNPGVARPATMWAVRRQTTSGGATVEGDDARRTPGVIPVSRPIGSERTFVQGLTSLAGAAGIVLLLPIATLLIGIPVALGVRGVLELIEWLFGALR